MLNELKIDELLDKVDSRYGLVLVAARRAREINEYVVRRSTPAPSTP